jgi:UDP-GlcNAc:undecaprenyl-phosphate GlcNAc-1-phosphate transferase
VVAAVAIESSVKQETAFLLAVPLAICAIPILDAGAALVRRITTGQSVFTADRGHLHHALLLRGWSVNKTVLIISSLAALTCGGALASYFTGYDLIAVAISLAVFLTLAAARVFGHADGFTTSAPRKATRCWPAIPTRKPGSGNASNARQIATTPTIGHSR